jgi:benzoyl-CoA-dihydrodiol lyase
MGAAGERDGETPAPVVFETHPDRYRHWRLEFPTEHAGRVARLVLDVNEAAGLRPGYALKLNSYDLAVDIELADALDRVRFEHPEVKAIVFASGKDRVFSAGANIYMLGASSHPFKVNFCKFTNETRIGLEELSAASGVASLAALAGTASGGGYELALACDAIALSDDGASVVSLPEAPLLAVLPGTGGLTRLVDKRKVRRDLADAFATMAEGVRAQRALEWGLVDEAPARREFEAAVQRHLTARVERSARRTGAPIVLEPLGAFRHVSMTFEVGEVEGGGRARRADITVSAPADPEPETIDDLACAGSNAWAIRVWRELDAALLDLRFNHPEVGVVALRTRGDPERVLAVDAMLARNQADGLAHEVTLLMKRTLKRLDNTARSFFALIEPGSCFAGSLAELALAADRSYMLDGGDAEGAAIQLSAMSAGLLPMGNGLTRLQSRFLGRPDHVAFLLARGAPFDARSALEAGLVTFAPDALDWDDEVRVAFEERASLSPDALTGLEASLRYGGPETLETKIFGRLSSWQNWIFQRPNAAGPRGALSLYGKAERPGFDFRRT